MSELWMATARRARKPRRCDNVWAHDGARPVIAVGDVYVANALPPGSNLGNTSWWHGTECAACAAGTPRAALVNDREQR